MRPSVDGLGDLKITLFGRTYPMNSLVSIVERNGSFFVSSEQIAEKFGKPHKNIIRTIRNLKKDLSNDFYGLNFEPVDIPDKNKFYGNNPAVRYMITRDGFSILVMALTGRKAGIWKERFLEAFNSMEKQIIGEIPKLKARIAELEARKPQKRLPSPEKSTLMTPQYQEDLLGKMILVGFERCVIKTLDKVDLLEAQQVHMLKIIEGLHSKFEAVASQLNVENRTRSNSIMKIVKPIKEPN